MEIVKATLTDVRREESQSCGDSFVACGSRQVLSVKIGAYPHHPNIPGKVRQINLIKALFLGRVSTCKGGGLNRHD